MSRLAQPGDRRQRGMLLLSVSLMLAMLAALAFAMSRESAMAAQTVDAQYDAAQARFLAEAGLNLARWKDEQAGCKNTANLPSTSLTGIGSFSATVATGSTNGASLKITATGVTPTGAKVTIFRDSVIVHDLTKPTNVTLKAGGSSSDTFLSSLQPLVEVSGTTYLELTQGLNTALLQFDLGPVKTNSSVVKADLKLYQYQSASSPPGQVVSVHRVSRDWDNHATWLMAKGTTPWTNASGDYTAANVASATLSGNGATTTWDIAAMVDGWSERSFVNNGLLLRPDGPLQQVRFASMQSNSYARPIVDVTFYPPC